jgi:hypothetical protein
MADFRIVRSLVGDTYEIKYATADEALEEGDICNFDADAELEKVDNDADEQDLVIVLADADADEEDVPYVWLHPWIEIEGLMNGTVGDVGDIVKLDVTANVIKFEAATAALGRFMLTETGVGGTAAKCRAVRVFGAGMS